MKKRKNTRKSRYQKNIIRKPKYGKEFLKVFSILLVVTIIFNMIWSVDMITKYKEYGEELLLSGCDRNRYVDDIITSLEEMDGHFDYNKVVIKDRKVFANCEQEKREKMGKALSKMQYRAGVGYSQNMFSYTFLKKDLNILNEQLKAKISGEDYWKNITNNALAGKHYAIYNAKGEQLTDVNGEHLFQMLSPENLGEKSKGDNKGYSVYQLDVERLEKFRPGLYQELYEAVNFSAYISSIKFDEIHISGTYFVPEKIQVIGFGNIDILSVPGKLIKPSSEDESLINAGDDVMEYDLTGIDISGYGQKITLEDGDAGNWEHMIGPVFAYSDPKVNASLEYFKHIPKAQIQKNIRRAKSPDLVGCVSDYKTTRFGIVGSAYEKATYNDSIIIVSTVDYNFFRDYKYLLCVVYSGSLFIILIISFIIAGFRYMKKKSIYEIDAYRRQMTNTMAHDLKSPLMAISGYTENLLMVLDDDDVEDKKKQYISNILETTNYMNNIISNILDLAKLEQNQLPLVKEEISMKEFFEQALTLFENEIHKRGLSIVFEGERDLTIEADSTWMKQLCNNLISNIVKYAKEKTKILIVFEKNAFSISNEYEQEINKSPEELMDPFVKGDDARSKAMGTGMGLSVVKNIVENHGFKMKITTENLVFTIKISK